MSTSTPITTSDDRGEALRGVVDATAAAVSTNGANAAVVFRASGRGESGVATDIRIGRHKVLIDEPPALGGADAAPNPVEFALAGLLSCQVVTYRFWAAKLEIPLDDVHVDVEGELDVRGFFGLDNGVRPGLGEIRIKVRLTGPASPEQYRELQVAVDQHCPVLDLFSHPTLVRTELVAS
jgi:uncharacterized OsmC-like protein